VGISGAGGLIGSALARALTADGAEVLPLVRGRSAPGNRGMSWDPATGELGAGGGGTLDAVVHLAGENVAASRWTRAFRERLVQSRVGPTRRLCETLARAVPRPRVLISASALGYYGDRGDVWLDEQSGPGSGFLARLCTEWEQATEPARAAGIRVVGLRIGVVLDPARGSLAKVLPLFRAGLGGPIGGGAQYLSWVSLRDVVGAIRHALASGDLAGPVNAVAPEPVTNAEFTRALARVLGRPAIVGVPAFAVRLMFGLQGEELLLASARIRPRRLLETGYRFADPELAPALERMLRPQGQ
jgi:uncharacterized protein (TIGR01777 family)